MAIFDNNVKCVLEYAAALTETEVRHALLVALVKGKARYSGVDLFAKFYSCPYDNGNPSSVKDACGYLALLPLLQKLYDKARAYGREKDGRFWKKPDIGDIDVIKKKIENF